jgi:hypothetical protein
LPKKLGSDSDPLTRKLQEITKFVSWGNCVEDAYFREAAGAG